MIIRLRVARITEDPALQVFVTVTGQVQLPHVLAADQFRVLEQYVADANAHDGKIVVIGTRPVPVPTAGPEDQVVQAEVYGGSFLVFEAAARRLGADAGHPFLVLCQAARELGAAGSRPLQYSVEIV